MSVPQQLENGNMPYTAVIKQLQADMAKTTSDVADIKQSIAVFPRLMADYDERLIHIIGQNDRIVRWATDDDDPGAWHAALKGISVLVDRMEKAEAALAATADRLDVLTRNLAAHDTHVETRIVRVAEGQADDIRRIARRQLILVGAMTALAVLMLIHSYEVAARLDAAFVPAFTFLLGLVARGR